MQHLHVGAPYVSGEVRTRSKRSALQSTVPYLKGLNPPLIIHYLFDRGFATQKDIGRSETVLYSDAYGTTLRENPILPTRTDHVVLVIFPV